MGNGLVPPVSYLCAKCRYDLVGVAKSTCPACGAEFDRRDMMIKLGHDPHIGPKVALGLLIAPALLVAFVVGLHLASVELSETARRSAIGVIFVIAVASPLVGAALVFTEFVVLYKHWAKDAVGKLLMSTAILATLIALEASAMIGAYFVCYLASTLGLTGQ